MKAITVRGMPGEIERLIEGEAAKSGESLNRVIIRLIEKGAGRARVKTGGDGRHHDLDRFCGVLSGEEGLELENALKEQRRVEEEMWK